MRAMSGDSRPTQTIAVLEADPALAVAIHESELEDARREAVAGVLRLDVPHWDPSAIGSAATDEWLGLLMIDGLMMRRVTVGRRQACELLGPGI